MGFFGKKEPEQAAPVQQAPIATPEKFKQVLNNFEAQQETTPVHNEQYIKAETSAGYANDNNTEQQETTPVVIEKPQIKHLENDGMPDVPEKEFESSYQQNLNSTVETQIDDTNDDTDIPEIEDDKEQSPQLNEILSIEQITQVLTKFNERLMILESSLYRLKSSI